MDYTQILQFWFTECTPKDWYKKNEAFDEDIRRRFLPVHTAIAAGETRSWQGSPQGRLAEIIVLDQFSRNMFRDTPRAFAYDALALGRAQKMVEAGEDIHLSQQERGFAYLPYMHSESSDIHIQGFALFEALGDEKALRYEKMHKEIIDQFGRFPHRNHILGRTSTPEEVEFLKTHKGF